jgi:transcription termination factor Rho
MREMKLQDLKAQTPAELVSFAEEKGVENASTMRKQELMFAILKQLAIQETDIIGEGVVELLSDGFGGLTRRRPSFVPFALARASPALTRSRIIPRSNSANTPSI